MTSCITCNVSSSDSSNRSRTFCIAGAVYLKGKFQNYRIHNFLMFNSLQLQISLTWPINFVCVWNACCNQFHCSFPVILSGYLQFSVCEFCECFGAFHPLFSSTDMTDSFVWFILFLHSSDSFKFCFLQDCISDFHILCSCSHFAKSHWKKSPTPVASSVIIQWSTKKPHWRALVLQGLMVCRLKVWLWQFKTTFLIMYLEICHLS